MPALPDLEPGEGEESWALYASWAAGRLIRDVLGACVENITARFVQSFLRGLRGDPAPLPEVSREVEKEVRPAR